MPKKNQEEMLMGSLPKGAQEHIKRNKIAMSRHPRRKRQTKYHMTPQKLLRNEGFDILENLMIVRSYVCKKYKIEWHLLEILLYLYPKDYFTLHDYFEMPKYFKYNRFSMLEALGMVRMVSKEKTRKSSMFALSVKGKNIVTNFYMFLGGEKKIPIRDNPLNHPEASALDKIKFKLIHKINAAGPSESKKGFFK